MQKSSQEHRSGQSGTTELYAHTIGALSCEYHDSVVIVLESNHLQNFVYVIILKVKNYKVAIPCAVCVGVSGKGSYGCSQYLLVENA